MNATDGSGNGLRRTRERRAHALRDAIQRAHASDRRRVLSGELNPADLFWISEDDAKRAQVSWPDNYRANV